MREKFEPNVHKRLKRDGNLHELVVNPSLGISLRYRIQDNVLKFRFLWQGKVNYGTQGVKVTTPVIHLDMTKEIHLINQLLEGITGERITDSVQNCPRAYGDLNEVQFTQLAVRLHDLFLTEQTKHHRIHTIAIQEHFKLGKVTFRF